MRKKSFIKLCLAFSLAILAGGANLPAQEPDQAALQAARKLRAEAAYQELKGNPVEAARLFEESLKHVADEKVAARVRELRGEEAGDEPVAVAEELVPEVRFIEPGKLMVAVYADGELSLVEIAYP